MPQSIERQDLFPKEIQSITMVSAQALNEFKEIYKAEYGIDLDNQTAMDIAEKLLTLMKAVYKPIKSGWLIEMNAGKQTERKDGYGKQENVK